MKKNNNSLLTIGLLLGGAAILASSSSSSAPLTKPMVQTAYAVPSIPSIPQSPDTFVIPGQSGVYIVQNKYNKTFDGKMTYYTDPLPHPFN